ncbi:HNH endonuclease [Streptomyces sp. NPDC086782]|uniref:HNH endonuclease signature motif containing protein n=1 Tax=Streptomyces sp. NPDC086782 TaxID=3365757 RepID=UPI0038155AC0
MTGVRYASAPGYPGYTVSSDGRVFGPRGELKPRESSTSGYSTVALGSRSHGTGRQVSLHRLILWAFEGPPPGPGYDCDHIDGDHTNNDVANLRWLGARENRSKAGEANAAAKLTATQVLEIRGALDAGEAGKVLATRYGVTPTTISYIKTRRAWAHI